MRQRFTFIKTNEVEEDFDEEERVLISDFLKKIQKELDIKN